MVVGDALPSSHTSNDFNPSFAKLTLNCLQNQNSRGFADRYAPPSLGSHIIFAFWSFSEFFEHDKITSVVLQRGIRHLKRCPNHGNSHSTVLNSEYFKRSGILGKNHSHSPKENELSATFTPIPRISW